jgi:CIC family chloride channel protein
MGHVEPGGAGRLRPGLGRRADRTVSLPQQQPGRPSGGSASRMRIGEGALLLVLSVLVGAVSGLAVTCFRTAVDWWRILLLGPDAGAAAASHRLSLILAPSLAGVVIAVLVIHLFPTIRRSGVNQTKMALYIDDGEIPFRSGVGKFLASSLAVGSGHSLGPEDPSLHIGAAIGSLFGRTVRLARDTRRLIAPIGAAAGLAAAFNAPLSAVLFTIEEITGRWTSGILLAGMMSASASAAVARWLLGAAPIFGITAPVVAGPAELLAYACIGVAGGIASVVFARMIGMLRLRLKALPRWTQYVQPAAAGLLVGLIGYFGAPEVMGAGYEVIDRAARGVFTWEVLGVLAGLKIVATTLSLTSGTPGGMFAPTLVIGGLLGAAVGGAGHALFPSLATATGTCALIGMGALFAGFLRAPLTALVMVVEASGNPSTIVPVIIAGTLAYLISRRFQPLPIFDLIARQDGLDLPSMEHEREAAILRVEDVMRPPPSVVLAGTDTVAAALDRLRTVADEELLVYAPGASGAPGGAGWFVVGRSRLKALADRGDRDLPLAAAVAAAVPAGGTLPRLYPDAPVGSVLQHVYAWPVLPVLHRADTAGLCGVLTLDDVLIRYEEAAGQEHGTPPLSRSDAAAAD